MPVVASTGCGKGDGRRPCQVPTVVADLRYDLATGRINRRTYRRRLKRAGLDRRYK